MVDYGFGRNFHDLNYFEVEMFYLYIFLGFIIYLRAPSQNFVEKLSI